MDITGQSIRTEPISLGIEPGSFHPTAMDRFLTAKSGGSRSSKSVYDRELASQSTQPAMAITEALQRTLADDPRKTTMSNGVMSRPLISGRASLEFQPDTRMNDFREGSAMMANNTRIVERNTPQIVHI